MTKTGSYYLHVKCVCLGPFQYFSHIMIFYLCVLLLIPHQPDDVPGRDALHLHHVCSGELLISRHCAALGARNWGRSYIQFKKKEKKKADGAKDEEFDQILVYSTNMVA